MEPMKEKLLNERPSMISYENTLEILNQMNKYICKIKMGDGVQGTGFFCKIPFPEEENLLPILITNNHIINQQTLSKENEIISSLIKNEQKVKLINLSNRKSYTNSEYDITMIELKNDDDIQNFLELDDYILNNILDNDNNNNSNHIYLKETLYILQYPEGKLSVSYGVLDNILEDKNITLIIHVVQKQVHLVLLF